MRAPTALVLSVVAGVLAGCSSPPAPARPPAEPARVAPAALEPDPPIACSSCDEWNAPRAPFTIFGNSHFVGTQGLSSVLITTDDGLVLIDVALPQSAPLVSASIEALGFRPSDVTYILTSHAHYDHLGGVRSMQRYTGATVLASASTAQALALGHPVTDDPQFGTGPLDAFPAVTEHVRVMKDGESVQVGGTTITAHYTPGHTPGATTWTWQSCEGARCLDMVYVDSLTSVSKDGYRFTEVPGAVDTFRATLRKVSALPCDVVISTHPSATSMDDRLAARVKATLAPGAPGDPLVDSGACRALAERSMKMLDDRVQAETARK